ncbi:hypothetical protein EDD37DRAFT_67765 [Exophiala viscosa]|uniref:uncharacterized protein n=1 Tax=Exophiala viscosa TaxID=2486360 RepID=UPI00219CD754|nr:hypothetical protein EDD37DRAFT_67765 [Exophiala viscosa]
MPACATEQAQVNSCAQTDYSCLCTQYGNLLTCYNNCPNDPGATTVQQDREQYCNAAAVDGSTTTMGVVSATNASTAASIIATSASITSGESIASSTGTSSSATASSTPSQHNGVTRTEMENSLTVVALAGLGLVL